MDGTLVDSNEFHIEAWRTAFLTFDLNIPKQVIRKQIGKGADMLVPTLAPQLSESDQKTMGERQGELFRADFLKRVQPFKGAREFIQLLYQRKIKVVLASSSGKQEIDHYVELLGVRDMIHAVTTKDDVSQSKPAPDIFSVALKKIAPVQPHDVIAIGDTPYDGIAATQCGICTFGLRTGGFGDNELTDSGMSAIYDSIEDVYLELRK